MNRNAQKGFSLIELMVVVAIIGVLAMIAIPRVTRFIAKSRTSEAQVNLSSVYTFNKNFFVEYQGYSNSFQAIGYAPEGQLRYNIGWGAAAYCPNAFNALKTAAACGAITNAATWCGVLGGTAGTGSPDTCDLILGPGRSTPETVAGTVSDTAFTAQAAAVLVANSTTADVDLWQIDQNKNLQNTNDGTDGQ